MGIKGDFKVGEISVDKLEVTDKLTLEFSALATGSKDNGLKVNFKGVEPLTGAASGFAADVGLAYITKDVHAAFNASLLGKEAGKLTLSSVFSPAASWAVGLDTEFNINTTTAKANGVAARYNVGKDLAFGLQAQNAFKTLRAAFFLKSNSDVTVAADCYLPLPGSGPAPVSLQAGLVYKASDSGTLYAAANNKGKVSAAFEHVLSPLATMCFSMELDAVNPASDDHRAFGGGGGEGEGGGGGARSGLRPVHLLPLPPATHHTKTHNLPHPSLLAQGSTTTCASRRKCPRCGGLRRPYAHAWVTDAAFKEKGGRSGRNNVVYS